MIRRDFVIAYSICIVVSFSAARTPNSSRSIIRLAPDSSHASDASIGCGKCTSDRAYCLLLLSFRVTGARSLGFPGSFARGRNGGEEFHERVCATFERPAFLFLFNKRSWSPLFSSSPLSLSIYLSVSFSFRRPFSISLASLETREQRFSRACARVWPG